MASYCLLPMRRYGSLVKWVPFQLGERTRWTVELRIARIDPGASITVILETSPTGEERDFTTLASFGAKTAIGVYTLDATKDPAPDFTINVGREVWIRASILAISGQIVAEVTAAAPFLALKEAIDLKLLSKELREWQDGQQRTFDEAEADVINMLIDDAEYGDLDIDLSVVGVHDLIQAEIVNQAEHVMRRYVLSRSHEPSDLVSLRSMSRLYPGAGLRLRKYRTTDSFVWQGR